MPKIEFGTDGWRAVISDDFTFENVKVAGQAIADFVNSRKPEWWKGDFIVTPVQTIPSSDKQAEFKKVQVVYETPMITPFYLTMFEAVSGKKTLRLVAHAAFQIPRNVP